jgi:hypothetical protein
LQRPVDLAKRRPAHRVGLREFLEAINRVERALDSEAAAAMLRS